MNRADRRRQQKEESKNKVVVTKENIKNLFSRFTERDCKIIDKIIDNRVNAILENSSYIMDMIYTAKLSDMGFTWEQASKFNNDVIEIFNKDKARLEEIEKEFGEESGSKMVKMAGDVEGRIEELIREGMSRKDVIETILYEFPKLTKSMVTSTYSKVQSDLKKEQEKEESVEDQDIVEGAKEVMNIIEGGKNMSKNNFQEKTEKGFKNEEVVVTKATVEQVNLNSPTEVKGLKIKSMVVEGENGTYRVCSEGVELKSQGLLMFFENPEQLDNFYKEYKQTFEMLKV